MPRGDRRGREPDRDGVDEQSARRAAASLGDRGRWRDLAAVPPDLERGGEESQREHRGERQLKARAQRLGRHHGDDRGRRDCEHRVAAPASRQNVAESDRERDDSRADDRRLGLDDDHVRAGHERYRQAAKDAVAHEPVGHAARGSREDREIEARDRNEMCESRVREVAADLVAVAGALAEEHHAHERGGVGIEVSWERRDEAGVEPRAQVGHAVAAVRRDTFVHRANQARRSA